MRSAWWKFFSVAAIVAALLTQNAHAQREFPTAEEIYGALSTCALNVNLTVNANIVGSLKALFEDASADGAFTVSTTTEFLQLFPDQDKLLAYRAYRQCMFTALQITADTICPPPEPDPFTRVALARFSVNPALAGSESILAVSLQSFLRNSRQFSVVFSENDAQQLQALADADPLTAVMFATDTTHCSDRAEQIILPSAAAIGQSIAIQLRVIDVETQAVLKTVTVNGDMSTLEGLDLALRAAWRGVEGGLAPESWIWRDGVGFCNKLRKFVNDMPTAQCRGDEWSPLMFDVATGVPEIDSCQATWRRNDMEPTCLFECQNGQVTNLSLYHRLDATGLVDDPRSASEQRAFIERLKTNFGYTDEDLAKYNILLTYPGRDLTEPETVFQATLRDLQSCLSEWSMGEIEAGSIDGQNAEYGSKHVSFRSGQASLTVEVLRWASEDVLWSYLSAYLK